MIGRGFRRDIPIEEVESKGFDAFELRLGDLMRGERATMGKSLLDVQRELKIKAAYIAAIENADPTAFDTPGFIAGYVRSYARYLNMEPDWAFETFCKESGFAPVHGMSAAASPIKSMRSDAALARSDGDIFSSPATPFIPPGEALFSGIEPRAVGSLFVLLALIGGIGYGGWTVLQEVQKVRFAPVEQTPTVLANVDPLAGGARLDQEGAEVASFAAPSVEALNRLYRPQALDVPVMVARDQPISTLNPAMIGVLAPANGAASASRVARADGTEDPVSQTDAVAMALAEAMEEAQTAGPMSVAPAIQVTETPPPEVQLVAVRPAWVRVQAPDGTVIYETTMKPGDTFVVPQTEKPATLRVGESGALYFAVKGEHYGPVGRSGAVTSNIALSSESLTQTYALADITRDNDLARMIQVAEARPGE